MHDGERASERGNLVVCEVPVYVRTRKLRPQTLPDGGAGKEIADEL